MPTPTAPDHEPADATARRDRTAVEALRATARAFAARSRAAQGLPPHVQDPEVIAKLVVLFRPEPSDDQPGQHPTTTRMRTVGQRPPVPADRPAAPPTA